MNWQWKIELTCAKDDGSAINYIAINDPFIEKDRRVFGYLFL